MRATAVVNAFGTQGYHKGYVKDRYTYSVLTIDKLTKEEKETIRARVKTLTTVREAQETIGNGWTYENLDQRGRVGVLKYHGVEVALFLERQLTQERPGPGDPVPEHILEDPVNLWQRLDVIGPSAKQANSHIKNRMDKLAEKETLLEQRCENLQQLASAMESLAERKQQSIEGLNEQITKLYQKFLPDDRIIAKQAGYRYLAPGEAKTEKAKLAKKKKKARTP